MQEASTHLTEAEDRDWEIDSGNNEKKREWQEELIMNIPNKYQFLEVIFKCFGFSFISDGALTIKANSQHLKTHYEKLIFVDIIWLYFKYKTMDFGKGNTIKNWGYFFVCNYVFLFMVC